MNPSNLWAGYRDGHLGFLGSLSLGAITAAVALLASFAFLKPLVRAFSRKDIPKVLHSRLRRTGFSLTVASLSLGLYILCHGFWPAEVRVKKLTFEVSELMLIVFTGYVFLEILLSFFGDFLPRVRDQA